MMRATSRAMFISGLLLLTWLSAGCNVLSLPYFIAERMSGRDSKQPAMLVDLAPKEKDQQTRVVVVGYSGLVSQPEFVTADREITSMLCHDLEEAYRDEGSQVVLVPSAQVNRYKDSHPDWHLNLAELGKHFHADYVVYLEMGTLSMYENKSFNQFYRGRADMQVSVVDMHKPDDYLAQKDYRCEYPRGAPVPAEDCSPQKFQRTFYAEVAKHLSWYFAPHDAAEDFTLE